MRHLENEELQENDANEIKFHWWDKEECKLNKRWWDGKEKSKRSSIG